MIKTEHPDKKCKEKQHNNHVWMMLLACGGAVALLFVLPIISLSKQWTTIISFGFMIGLHLLMMKNYYK